MILGAGKASTLDMNCRKPQDSVEARLIANEEKLIYGDQDRAAKPSVSYKNILLGVNGANQDIDSSDELDMWNSEDDSEDDMQDNDLETLNPLCPHIPITTEERKNPCRPWKKAIIIKLLGRRIGYRFLYEGAFEGIVEMDPMEPTVEASDPDLDIQMPEEVIKNNNNVECHEDFIENTELLNINSDSARQVSSAKMMKSKSILERFVRPKEGLDKRSAGVLKASSARDFKYQKSKKNNFQWRKSKYLLEKNDILEHNNSLNSHNTGDLGDYMLRNKPPDPGTIMFREAVSGEDVSQSKEPRRRDNVPNGGT